VTRISVTGTPATDAAQEDHLTHHFRAHALRPVACRADRLGSVHQRSLVRAGLGQAAVLDEDTGPSGTSSPRWAAASSDCTPSPKGRSPDVPFTPRGSASTTCPSPARIERNSNSGRRCWTRWACSTAASRMLDTAPGCRSRIPTGCRWRSPALPRPDRRPDTDSDTTCPQRRHLWNTRVCRARRRQRSGTS